MTLKACTEKSSIFAGQIFVAEPSDAVEIAYIVNEAYKKDAFRQGLRCPVEKVCSYFDPLHTWYVIKLPKEDKMEIIYTILYSTDAAVETKTQGNIHMLAARASYQGKKLSYLLLRKVEERAREEQKKTIRLIAAKDCQPLCAFYEQQGYRDNGKTFTLPNVVVKPAYEGSDGLSKIVYQEMEKIL